MGIREAIMHLRHLCGNGHTKFCGIHQIKGDCTCGLEDAQNFLIAYDAARYEPGCMCYVEDARDAHLLPAVGDRCLVCNRIRKES